MAFPAAASAQDGFAADIDLLEVHVGKGHDHLVLDSGLTDVELSVRLRRSLGENVNIYTGVIHERLLGGTRDIAIAHGETAKVTRAIFGIGLSFWRLHTLQTQSEESSASMKA